MRDDAADAGEDKFRVRPVVVVHGGVERDPDHVRIFARESRVAGECQTSGTKARVGEFLEAGLENWQPSIAQRGHVSGIEIERGDGEMLRA